MIKNSPDHYHRVLDVIGGRKPDRVPFIARLELWYRSHCREGTLPEEFCISEVGAAPPPLSPEPSGRGTRRAKALTEIHRLVGMGRELMLPAFCRRLKGVELVVMLNGEPRLREKDPVLEAFPRLDDIIPLDRPGLTQAEFVTPYGRLRTQSRLLPEMVAAGTVPYLEERILKEKEDFRKLEFILGHSELVPRFESIRERQSEMGTLGFAVPMINRNPFQQLLLDFVGELPLFYMLHDSPGQVDRLMALLDQRFKEDIVSLRDLDWPYVEFDDNLDGLLTSPRLFQKFSLPYYQAYTDSLHGQGKKVGSHTDGNIKPLLGLLSESGLDVCESFTPRPVTQCTLDEARDAWRDKGPLIWGGIPSPLLEERTSEEEFRRFIDRALAPLGRRPMILGICDMVMGNNRIERVRYIAERIETEGE